MCTSRRKPQIQIDLGMRSSWVGPALTADPAAW
jgi:hypothetical protein